MNRRGHRLPLYNKAHYGYEEQSLQMNFAMPLFLSSQKYAVHFDQPSTGFLDLDSQKITVLCMVRVVTPGRIRFWRERSGRN
jgi:hypothetical protein